MMRVHVLVLDGVFDLGLSAVLDVFQTANELIEASTMAIEPLEVKTVAVRRRVKTSQGLLVPLHRVDRRTPYCVVVPAIGYKMPSPLEKALSRSDVQDAAQLLRDYAKRDTTVTAACIGTFVLAESGLLSGHAATTTWWLAPLFPRRYPDVVLEDSSMIVNSGPFVTAGAALGHMNDAARAVWSSKRTLARRLQTVLGRSPLEYFQSVRVERAVHLLKTTEASVEEIAARVGYADGVTLRTLLRRRLHAGVKEIRPSSSSASSR